MLALKETERLEDETILLPGKDQGLDDTKEMRLVKGTSEDRGTTTSNLVVRV